ncbi:membrane protein MLC1 isoform X1 [Spea bombifrons]|uniref:membrane protein MLC1 isoform X1 n=1 Tax=Spea bombifrons TaxID=233779 RepID=UPI0023491E3B|nr:membrane protein MLC1 isoform X1 [Spea bombifrons]
MDREELYSKDNDYDKKATLELRRQEDKTYHCDIKSSGIQLTSRLHPCVMYKSWIFSLLMGSCLLATSGFSFYLGNIYPSEMDYLRCAAGSCVPSVVVNFAMLKNKGSLIAQYQVLFISTFSITTTCLIWFGCKLAINPTAININFNLILLVLIEILVATNVIIAARSDVDFCQANRGVTRGNASFLKHVKFPARIIKCYSIVEVITGVCAVFGSIVALNNDALLHSPYLYVSIFWLLAASFPSAIASHVAAEYPNKCLVEVVITTCSITSPLLSTTAAYLSFSVVKIIGLVKTYPETVTLFHDILILVLMLILLVQALLTNLTVVQCIHYKSQNKISSSSWKVSNLDELDYRNYDVSSNAVSEFDKDKSWKTVMVQMSQ